MSNFSRRLRPFTYFLVGLCGALAMAIVSFSGPVAPVHSTPLYSAPAIQEAQVQAPISEFALETAASHRAPNFYQ